MIVKIRELVGNNIETVVTKTNPFSIVVIIDGTVYTIMERDRALNVNVDGQLVLEPTLSNNIKIGRKKNEMAKSCQDEPQTTGRNSG